MVKAHQETLGRTTRVALAVADIMVVAAALVVVDTAVQEGSVDLGDMVVLGAMADTIMEDLPMDATADLTMALTRDTTAGHTDLQVDHEASVVEAAGAHGGAAASSAAVEAASTLRASQPTFGTNSTTP
jgi:hypothetical protein